MKITKRLTNRYGGKGVISSINRPFIERYSCECKNKLGKLNEGLLCLKCNTEVKYRDYVMDDLIDTVDMYLDHRLLHFGENEEDDIFISGLQLTLNSTYLKKSFVMINKDKKEYAIGAMNRSMHNIKPILEIDKPICLYFGLNNLNALIESINKIKLNNDDTVILCGSLNDDDILKLIENFNDRYIIEYK